MYFSVCEFHFNKNLKISRLSKDTFVLGGLWPLSEGINPVASKVESDGPVGTIRSDEKWKA